MPADRWRKDRTAARVLRLLLGAAGLVLMGTGLRLLAVETTPGDPQRVAVWLGGVVLVHDLLLVPLVLAAGLVLGGLLGGGPGRGVLRAGLVTAGSVTLVAAPALLRPGAVNNPTALPLDYPRNWALVTGAVLLAAVAAGVWRRLRAAARRGRPAAPPPP
ncbi:hypothetical protein [Streptomyces aidingensis]|uniref:Uncharacterized protein n=1 Tax=Streptomyces aidingensis TaxID=910347 RepID=A0A1I1MEW4_9ACTN|nr:hypothetical protein [Streptomyces aidingensis]SFC83919.1 hypothetical protein SAMN05421773_106226 [Streptomyces aidingensis]